MSLDTWLAIAGIIVAFIALALAVSPFAQLWWGRPHFEIGFAEPDGATGRVLMCTARNVRPSKFLRAIGVRREAGEVQGFFDIIEQGTNKIIVKDISAKMENHVREEGLIVRARPHFHVVFVIVQCTPGGCVTPDIRKNETTRIPNGDYTAKVTLVCDEQFWRESKNFKAHTDPARTFWY